MPIALAGLGGLWSERAGVVNIGLEGMMILGTLGPATSATTTASWAGISARVLFGALGGLLHALATVIFGVDHIVSGVAINIIAAGRRRFLAEAFFSGLRAAARPSRRRSTAVRRSTLAASPTRRRTSRTSTGS